MSSITGSWALTRLALRRDRVLIPAWIAVIVLSVVASAAATVDLYPSGASRGAAAAAVNDVPALVALYGRIWDPMSLGELSTMKLSAFGAALVGMLAVVLVIRHTRREEESGRLDLVGSSVVGRSAALAAALIVTVGTMIVIGLATALGEIAVGLPVAGSVAFGAAWALTGIAFASVAAVTAQLTVSARAAVSLATVVLAGTYALRAAGDTAGDSVESGVLSWLSPIGWGQQVRAFAGERWWVLVLPAVFSVMVMGLAFALTASRDLGAGLIPDRPGPPAASPWLGSPLGLAWRLQRGLLVGWVVGYAALGYFLGAITSSVGSMLTSDQARDIVTRLGGTDVLVDAFLAAEFGFIALATSAYGIAAAARLRAEEEAGHAEIVLATATSRPRWVLSHVVVALAGTTLLCAVAGLSAGLAVGLQAGTMVGLGDTVLGVLVYLPAIWLLTALTVFLAGALPRLIVLAWTALVGALLIGEFGVLLDLPAWAIDLSPFAHIPRLPGGEVTLLPLTVLIVMASALVAAGTAAFRRRDVPS